MLEGSMAIVKPEMKSYIWVQTIDGSIQQVEEEVAIFCPMIYREVLKSGMGSSKSYAISLPEKVSPATFGLILDYCRFHQVPGRSNKERKAFNEKFIRVNTEKLCELASASDSLQLRPLVDLTCSALARMIEGKTPEEIRETFHIPDDLTEEEKLEPIKHATDDPHIRLLNRLYARKRKELKERKQLKYVEVKEEPVDERSLDDLLSFINGDAGDSKGVRATKNKKKNRRRKDQPRDSSSEKGNGDYKKDIIENGASPNKIPKSQNPILGILSQNLEIDEGGYIDDEFDPAMKEELDREVEDFARRLNSVWPDRKEEFFSLGQERRFVQPPMNGSDSFKGFTGVET